VSWGVFRRRSSLPPRLPVFPVSSGAVSGVAAAACLVVRRRPDRRCDRVSFRRRCLVVRWRPDRRCDRISFRRRRCERDRSRDRCGDRVCFWRRRCECDRSRDRCGDRVCFWRRRCERVVRRGDVGDRIGVGNWLGFRYGDGSHSRDGQRGGRRRFERRWGSRSDCSSRIVGGRRRSQRGGDRDSCGYGGGGRRRRCVSWERSHTDVFRNWHGSRRRRGERSVDIRCTDREIEQGRALPSIPEVVADRSA
jgi:hypothetical protein